MDARVAAVVDAYWLARRRSLSTHTVEDYSRTFARLIQYTRNRTFADITAADINGYFNHLAAEYNLGPKSLLNAWIALSSLWTWAAREYGVPHVIRDGVDRPRAQRPQVQPFEADEVRRILSALEWSAAGWERPTAARDVAIVLVLLDTGLRRSELCGLNAADYDTRSGALYVRRGKGGKSRTVWLGKVAQRHVRRWLDERPDVAPLFATRAGRRMEPSSLRNLLLRAGERAGVVGVTPHRFRHTFAISFLRNGGDLFALQSLLGHSTLEMVRTYARLADRDVARAQARASPVDNMLP